MLSVSIATAFPVFREGLLRALHDQRGVQSYIPSPDAESVIRSCSGRIPDVLVLDVMLPGLASVALMRRLCQKGCRAAVVLFGDWTPESAAAAARAGARGLVSARDDTDIFLRAIHAVASGEHYTSSIVRQLLGDTESAPKTGESGIERLLTPTERLILRALADNRTSKEIAGELYISFRTVQKHRSNIVRKLQLDGTNALLTLAVRHFNSQIR